MAVKAKVQDLVDAFDMQGYRAASYFDRETGEVHVISSEALRIAEDGDGADDVFHDCAPEEIELAHRILDGDQYVALPTSWDVHEWRIMEAFCYSLGEGDVRAELLGAIAGRGAFRYFKEVLLRHGLRDSWHAFREEAFRKIAIDWCEEHEIAFQA